MVKTLYLDEKINIIINIIKSQIHHISKIMLY